MSSLSQPCSVPLASSLKNVSTCIDYISHDTSKLSNNLLTFTQSLYEYGNNASLDDSYTKNSFKVNKNRLVVDENFGEDEIWAQIQDRTFTLLSSVDNRLKSRDRERKKLEKLAQQQMQEKENEKKETDDENSDYPSNNEKKPIEEEIELLSKEEPEEKENDEHLQSNIETNDENKEQQIENAWDFISNVEKEQNTDSKDITDSESEINIDQFNKEANEMEDFLEKHYAKEERLQKEGIFDIFNDADIEQKAHFYDDEYGDITDEKQEKENEKQEKEDENQEENEEDDEFAWLQKNITTEDNIKKPENDDEWGGALLNLDKFPDVSKEQSLITIKNKNNLNIQIEGELQMSTFEMEEQAIRQKIDQLQETNMADRAWKYQGEVSNNRTTHPNSQREKNSLLQTYLDFDYSDKLKPVITEDLNSAIEKLIITKIKNKQFDDVCKKVNFANVPKVAKRRLIEIQDTKSSFGLAELYEMQYLQQIENKRKEVLEDGITNITSEDLQKQKQYEKINRLKSSLFYQLDQLTRFHFQPSNAAVIQDNIKVKTHTNVLFMEEQIPFSMNAQQNNISQLMGNLAPEQIYRKPKKFKFLVNVNELSKEEKKQKRMYNKKKSKFKNAVRNDEKMLRAEYDLKYKNHLKRIQSLNEIRNHAMAAAKKDGFLNENDPNFRNSRMDLTKYTSSKQMFAKIQQSMIGSSSMKSGSSNNRKRSSVSDYKSGGGVIGNADGNLNLNVKRRKISQLVL